MCKGGVTTRGDNQQGRSDRVKKSLMNYAYVLCSKFGSVTACLSRPDFCVKG